MKYQLYIEKLQNKQPLKLEYIKLWLKDIKPALIEAVKNTSCNKWKKWQRDNSIHIFPCLTSLCKIRNDECVFIEFYRKLDVFVKTIRTEDFYKNRLEQYQKIKHNQKAVFEWILDIEQYGNELTLINDEVDFKFATSTNYTTIKLDKTELQNLWKFKKIFEKHYYSLEFQNYINPQIF
jgi:hypothetical protein